MQIIHKIDKFLFNIFPSLSEESTVADIAREFEDYYTYNGIKPSVTINDGWAKIEIDADSILNQEADYKKAVALCEQGSFSKAKPILQNLIAKNPTNSEYHRIMGQILSVEGDQEEAINCLIDALRWDSKNGWALLMMGNIFAKFKDDVNTAMKYYDQALVVNPDDYITTTNIATKLMQSGKLVEAKTYLANALKINNQYPNTHMGLGLLAEIELDFHASFSSFIQTIKLCKNKDELYKNAVSKAFKVAQKIMESNPGLKIFTEYRHKLEFDGDKRIEITPDEEIPTAAKFEFAEISTENRML